MLSQAIISKLKCPYCTTQFSNIEPFSNNCAHVRCQCSIFPMLGNILLLKKTNENIENKILVCTSKGNYYQALWHALYMETKRNRFFLLKLTFFSKYIRIPTSIVLKILIFFDSKKKDWLNYVSQTKNRSLTKIAMYFLSKEMSAGEFIVDIGCGTGEILSGLAHRNNSRNFYIGIDKSLFSLILGSALCRDRSLFFIHFNVEKNMPIQSSSISKILLCDAFPWIKNKNRHLEEVVRIMKPKARAYIINIHRKLYQKKIQSFGISPSKMISLLEKKCKVIVFDHCKKKILSQSDQIKQGFSCIIQKK